MSFARLLERIKSGLSAPRPEEPKHDPIRLATATILLDIAWADGSFDPSEGGDLGEFLQRTFGLGSDETRELVEAAAEIRGQTIDHFALANFLRRNTTLDDRVEVVKMMWRVAYADDRLTDYEHYLVRKLADLLGLEHRVMIEAKLAVLREMGA